MIEWGNGQNGIFHHNIVDEQDSMGEKSKGIFRRYKVGGYNKMRERSKWYISSLSSICQIYRSN
jgi:hypothetical protein